MNGQGCCPCMVALSEVSGILQNYRMDSTVVFILCIQTKKWEVDNVSCAEIIYQVEKEDYVINVANVMDDVMMM